MVNAQIDLYLTALVKLIYRQICSTSWHFQLMVLLVTAYHM